MMMKNKLFLIVLLAAFSFGCEEIPPVVGMDVTPIDPTEEQVKNVLIEEYTGVQCVNCPAGAALIDGMKQQYGSRLVPIAVHAGGFAFPISGASTQVFFNTSTNAYMNFVGTPLAYPAANVDRKLFDSQLDIIQGASDWAASVAERLEEELLVEVFITSEYDDSNRTADVTVDLNPLASVDHEDLILTVVLLEDGIVDAQITPDGIDLEYVHKHVLRDFFTSTNGNSIAPLQVGNVVSNEFSLVLNEDFVAENCEVVAFVSRGGADKEVFQVNAVHLIE